MTRFILFILSAALLLPAGALAGDARLMAVSDLHYMDPDLYRGSELFLRVLQNGDGKITQYGDELLSALYLEILAQRPDALAVTGDLTYNGEKQSHLKLAAWFKTVEEAGVPVWIIPGNHDINVSSPLRFSGSAYALTEAVTAEEFADIYADFMLPGSAGFSYAVPVGDGLILAMTDVALYGGQAQTPGLFNSRHASWLEGVLKEAEGAKVVTATHHSLLPHTDFSRDSFLMWGNEIMKELAVRFGVTLNLSGHLHIQHIAREGDLSDAALGAFCVWPHRYAMVTLRGDSLTYEALEMDAAHLPEGFSGMSRDWFYCITANKIKASGPSGTPEEIEAMADYAARFNLAYFSGTFRRDDPAWTEDEGYRLWKNQPDSAFRDYMFLVMNEENGDNLRIPPAE